MSHIFIIIIIFTIVMIIIMILTKITTIVRFNKLLKYFDVDQQWLMNN